MSNRKMTLNIEMQPEISSRLLYISSSKYENDWGSFPHSHYFTEIFYIKSGSGRMQIEDKTFSVSSNTLILIGSRVQHTELSDPANPLDYYVLGAEGLKINTDHSSGYSVINLSTSSTAIHQCFENIYHEMHEKKSGYAEICQHYLAILIQLICRKDRISYELVDMQTSSRECYKTKSYIEANFRDKITLDCLAENCNLTKFYLSHKFSELYGKSPMAFLAEVRIAAAKDLLKTTNHSVEEIASSTGFSSGSYFSQTFQKHCGMSPQQYRKVYNGRDA